VSSEFVPPSNAPPATAPSEARVRDARLEILQLSSLLDTPPEEVFDRYTALASRCLGVPVSLVSLVDEYRQFFKSQVGLAEPWASKRETPLTHSFCKYVVDSGQPLVVENAPEHPLVKENLAIKEIGVVAYAGVPLQALGKYNLGSFCAIDTKPRQWSEQDLEILKALADAVTREIDLRFVAQQLHLKFLELQRIEVLREDMVQMLVHDLRTPLTSLLSGLQTLDAIMDPDPTQRQILDIAMRGGLALTQMVTTILDVSKGEAGELTLERRLLTPAALIGAAFEQVAQLGNRKGQSLSFVVPPDLPPLVADEEKLRRVLVNLLGNAIQHTPRTGKIEVQVGPHQDESGNFLLWCVSDNGSGIASEDFERIFQKFGQSGNPSEQHTSTGLGLTFCKLVIESHGGRIWVESTLGQGSKFFFTLPTGS
jgi:signal transduction histidine kinase